MNVKPKRKASCHPDRPHYADEKCKSCYQTSWERSSRGRRSYTRDPLVRTGVKGWGCL
jgi:hypothetical protein